MSIIKELVNYLPCRWQFSVMVFKFSLNVFEVELHVISVFPINIYNKSVVCFPPQDPQVDCYRTSRVQAELQLSRENLVGLAIFLGCDYIPKVRRRTSKSLVIQYPMFLAYVDYTPPFTHIGHSWCW